MTDWTPATQDLPHEPPPPAGAPRQRIELTRPDGLTWEQEIRAIALAEARAHLVENGQLPNWVDDQDGVVLVPHDVLDLADVYAAYIRDGSRP